MDAIAGAAERRMIMKCRECPDYAKCVKESNLAIKRKNCSKSKMEKVKTNADRIRSMSDEQLAGFLCLFHGLEDQIKFCQNLPECESLLYTEDGIPEEKCVGCLLLWLKQPSEG